MSATVTIKDTTAEEAALAAGAQLAPPSEGTKGGAAPAPAAPSKADTSGDVVNADKSVTTTDTRGRKITFKKLRSIERFRLSGILGDQSMNLPYAAIASVAYSVTNIDGVPFGPLFSLREVESVVSVLDDEGIDAVNAAYDRSFSSAAPSEDEVRTLVGN